MSDYYIENIIEQNEIQSALTNYQVQAESLKQEGLKMLLDSFKEFTAEENDMFYDVKEGVTRIKKYIEGTEYNKYQKMLSGLKCISKTVVKNKQELDNIYLIDLKHCDFLKNSEIPEPPTTVEIIDYEFSGGPSQIFTEEMNKKEKEKENRKFFETQKSAVLEDSNELLNESIRSDDENKKTIKIYVPKTKKSGKSTNKLNNISENDELKLLQQKYKNLIVTQKDIANSDELVYLPKLKNTFISFSKTNKLLIKYIPAEYITTFFDYSELEQIKVPDVFNKNMLLLMDRLEIRYPEVETDYNPFIVSDVNEEGLNKRANLLIKSRFDFLYKVCRVICKFVISIKKSYTKRKEKLMFEENEIINGNINLWESKRGLSGFMNTLPGLKNVSSKNLKDTLNKEKDKNINNQNIYYKDKFKCLKFSSCFNNDDMMQEYYDYKNGTPIEGSYANNNAGGNSHRNKDKMSKQNSSAKLASNNLLSKQNNFKAKEGLDNKINNHKNKKEGGEVINLNKLKHFLKKNMSKQTEKEDEHKRQILKSALYDSMKIIKKEDIQKQLVYAENEQEKEREKIETEISKDHSKLDDKSYLSNLSKLEKTDDLQVQQKKTKSNLLTFDKPADNDDNTSLLSKEKEDLQNFTKKMGETLGIFVGNLERTISPNKRIDTLGLKLFIKDSLAKSYGNKLLGKR